MTSVFEKLQAISNRTLQVAINKDDSYDLFGKYIASMLRGIAPPIAIKLQQNITNMVTNVLYKPEYLTTNNLISERINATSGRQSNLNTSSANNGEYYI